MRIRGNVNNSIISPSITQLLAITTVMRIRIIEFQVRDAWHLEMLWLFPQKSSIPENENGPRSDPMYRDWVCSERSVPPRCHIYKAEQHLLQEQTVCRPASIFWHMVFLGEWKQPETGTFILLTHFSGLNQESKSFSGDIYTSPSYLSAGSKPIYNAWIYFFQIKILVITLLACKNKSPLFSKH